MDAPELLPCPFCGGKAHLCTKERPYPWVAKCDECGATAGGSAYRNDEWNAHSWNTRTDRANELVAAAYEAAMSECADQFAAHMVAAIEGKPDNARNREASANMAERLLHRIRRLTPADAVAALAAREARIREAALREAVECAKTRQRMLGQVSPEAALALLDALPDAIESLIAKDKANG